MQPSSKYIIVSAL